jgi:hypothetical protein
MPILDSTPLPRRRFPTHPAEERALPDARPAGIAQRVIGQVRSAGPRREQARYRAAVRLQHRPALVGLQAAERKAHDR